MFRPRRVSNICFCAIYFEKPSDGDTAINRPEVPPHGQVQVRSPSRPPPSHEGRRAGCRQLSGRPAPGLAPEHLVPASNDLATGLSARSSCAREIVCVRITGEPEVPRVTIEVTPSLVGDGITTEPAEQAHARQGDRSPRDKGERTRA